MALSANAAANVAVDQELRTYPVGAAVRIYRGGWVGLDPAGHAKAFEPGDVLVGIAFAEANNTSGSAAAIDVTVRTVGDVEVTLTGVAITDIGRAVYAISDDPITASQLLFTGHPDAFVGRVVAYLGSNSALVRLKALGEKPGPGEGSIDIVENFQTFRAAVNGGATATGLWDTVTAITTLGTGCTIAAGVNGGANLDQDAQDEAASAGVYTKDLFLVSKGITFEARVRIDDPGGANTDHDLGLGTLLTANSVLDMSHADMVNKAAFHVNGDALHILAWTEKTNVEDTPIDTTLDHAAASYNDFKIIVRPAGDDVEFWIDKVRYLASSTFNGVATAAALCGFVNNEKSGTADAVSTMVASLRVAGVGA